MHAAGDARSLAAVIRRAATEEGLWQRLHDGIVVPAGREAMVEGMVEVYEARNKQAAIQHAAA